MKETLNWAGVVMAGMFLVLLWSHGSKVGATVKSQACQLVYVQQATAQHTADANAVIEWASQKR